MIRTLTLFLLVLLAGLHTACNRAAAATLSGTVMMTYSNKPYVGAVLIRPLSTPLTINGNLVTGGDFKATTDGNGILSVALQAGNYRVTIGADKGFIVDVPNDSNTYTWIERITSSLTWNSSITPSTNSSTASMISYTNVAQMIAATPPTSSGNLVSVLGRSTPMDGGGGLFWFDSTATTATNLGTVFAPASGSGRWLRAFDGELNALWFGANPNHGDSTAAFRDALAFAQNPTYGWSKDAGETYATPSIYVPPGAYDTYGPLTNYGVLFRGKAAQRSGNFTSETLFYSKHNGPFMVFDYGGSSSGLGVADYRVGAVDGFVANGYAETYQTSKAITAVTDRLTFRVALGDLPTLDLATFPEMNWCFFYSNEGQWLGAGQVASINSGTGDVTLVSGTDVYATIGGSLLRTADKVVFSPMSAGDEIGLGSFVDPAGAGPTCFWIKSSTGGVGNGPRISNILINGFHVGIRVGPGVLERRQQGLKFLASKFADVLFPREYNSTDSPWEGFTYLNGYYRADYGRTYTNAITNPSLQNGTFGFFGLGPLERVEQLLSEAHSYAQLAVLRTLSQHIDYCYLDLCIRHGLVVYRGYNTSSSSSLYDSVLSFGHLQIRSPLAASGYQTPDPIHPTDRSAVYIPNADSTRPVYLNADQFSVQDGGSGDFQQAFDVNATGGNKVFIDEVLARNGATTNWVKSGTSKPTIGQVSANLTSAEVGTGFVTPAANQLAMVLNGTNVISSTASGTTFTTQTLTPAITITRADTGKAYSWTPGTDAVVFNNDSQSRAFQVNASDASGATLTIGHSAATWSPRVSVIQGEVASSSAGTDVAPSDLYIVGERGTGANTTAGRIIFHTANSGASGTTPQTTATRLTIKREGQLNFTPMASDPTVAPGEGDLYYKTSTGFRYYNGSAWSTLGGGGASGAITPDSVTLLGTAGAGFVSFPAQSSAPSAPASGFVEYADSSGRVAWRRASDGFIRTFSSTLTANRTFTYPDADTTIPIASQQLTITGPTAARTITVPDASFTVARTDAAQSFTGLQTFVGNAETRNGTSGTQLEIFKTYSSAGANYESLRIDGGVKTASEFSIGTYNAGTGVARALSIYGGGGLWLQSDSGNVTLNASGTIALRTGAATRWNIGPNLTPQTANAVDLGGSGTEVRSLYLGTSAILSSAATIGWNADTFLVRNAANTVAARNSATAQRLQVFNTYTDASNGEWLDIDWITSANKVRIGSNKNGTGSTRIVEFISGGTAAAQIDSSGNLYPATSNGQSSGISGSRWNSVFVQTKINLGAFGADVLLTGEAANILQLGQDAGSATTQTIKALDGTGTDIAGSTLVRAGGKSTGGGRGGDLVDQTSLTGTAGTSGVNSYSTRAYQSAKPVNLTESVDTQFVTITVGTGKQLGAHLVCTVCANDGTDYQSLTSLVTVDAINKAGTITRQKTQVDNTAAVSAGTLTATYVVTDNGSGVIGIKCNAVSSLTQTVLRVKWSIDALNSDDVATVTPN